MGISAGIGQPERISIAPLQSKGQYTSREEPLGCRYYNLPKIAEIDKAIAGHDQVERFGRTPKPFGNLGDLETIIDLAGTRQGEHFRRYIDAHQRFGDRLKTLSSQARAATEIQDGQLTAVAQQRVCYLLDAFPTAIITFANQVGFECWGDMVIHLLNGVVGHAMRSACV